MTTTVKQMNIVATFLDLNSTYETVDRNILITKLQKIGINGTEDKWMSSYLSDNKCFYDIDEN